MNIADEVLAELYNRMDHLEHALQDVMQWLGPEAPKHEDACEGCQYEIRAALDACRRVGIEYKHRKKM